MNARLNTVDIKVIASALSITKRSAERKALAESWRYEESNARGGKKRLYPLAGLPTPVREAILHHSIKTVSSPGVDLTISMPVLSAAADSPITAVAPFYSRPTELKDWQRDTAAARTAIINEVKRLSSAAGVEKAIQAVIALAANGELPEQLQRMVPVANAKAGKDGKRILDVAINDKWLGALDASGFVTQGDYLEHKKVDAYELHSGTVFNLAHTPIAGSLRVVYSQATSDGTEENSMPFTLNVAQVSVAESHNFRCSYQWQQDIPRVRVKKRLGVAGTPADATTLAEIAASANPNQYTATCLMEGKTATIIRVDLDHPEFQGGIPNVKVKLRGKKVHDPRSPLYPNDIPAWSNNNALCIADYLTSEMCRVPADEVVYSGTAQAATLTSMTLPAGASSTSDAYRGMVLRITGGAGVWQQQVITAYDGTTKVATVESWAVNKFTWSDDFANAAWTKARATIQSNIALGPDGEMDADALIEDTTASNSHHVYRNATFAVGDVMVWCAEVKTLTGNRKLQMYWPATPWGVIKTATFDLENGTVFGTPSAGVTASVERLRDGWIRCIAITPPATVAGTISCQHRLHNGSTTVYTGDGVSGILIRRAQHCGSTLTPSIGTTSTAILQPDATSAFQVVTEGDLPLADYISAANACDEAVAGLGARYTLNGTVSADQDRGQVLESMALSMAGLICGTTWRIQAGVYSAPVMALSMDDVVGDFSYTAGSSDADLFNTVRGQYISAENNYVATDFKPYRNTAYLEADGRELVTDIDLPFTDSVQRAHNIARIITEDQRNAFSIEGHFSLRTWDVPDLGHRVTFTSPFLGQTNKIYRVTGKVIDPLKPVWLKMKEDAASIWDEADAVTPDSTPNTDLPNPFAIAPLETLTCESGTDVLLLNGDGTVTSRILASWPLATTQAVVHGGQIEVEWRLIGAPAWDRVTVTGDSTQAYLAPATDGLHYQVRARTVNTTLNIKSEWIYAHHQVIGKTALPSNVTVITATPTLLNVLLNWEEIPDADRKDYLIADDTGGGLVWNVYAGAQAKLPPASAGLHTYRILARDTSKNLSSAEATCQVAIDAPTSPTLSSAIKDGMVELTWNDSTATHQIQNYEVRHGASWAAGTFVARTDARSLRITPDWLGSRTFWVAGIDVAGNVGGAGSLPIALSAPDAPILSGVFDGAEAKLSWSVPTATLPVDLYEIRYGASWADGVSLGFFRATAHTFKADWLGSRTFWVAAVDRSGNTGSPDGHEMVITASPAPALITQVIDNNVLLRWGEVAGTLPTVGYELRKGNNWATAEPIGMKSGTFTTVFETAAGVYTYWMAAIDSAGNTGTPGSASASVNQPPDYVLKADYDSLLNGTKSNLALHGDVDNSLIGPVNTTETFAEHFTSNSWTTPQAQINAGYPVYAQPNLSPAYYEETIDYGTLLGSNRVTITPTTVDVVGAVAVSCRISLSADGVSYTDYDGVWQVYATGFRYVKFRLTFTASNTTDLIELVGVNIRIDAKLKSDAGMAVMTLGGAHAQHNIGPDYFMGGASAWVDGMTMPPSGYTLYGASTENRIVTGIGPSGQNEPIWACVDYDVATGADGGWSNSGYKNADNTIGHLVAVFMKTGTNSGASYWGLNTNSTILNLGGAVNANPYFWNGDLPALDTWYLVAGYVHPAGYGTTDTGISGVYDLTGARVAAGTEYKCDASLSSLMHRCLHNNNATGSGLEVQWMARPVIIPCTEAEAPGVIDYLIQCATAHGAAVAPQSPYIDIDSINLTPSGLTPTIPMYDFYDMPNPKWFNIFNYTTAGALTGGDVSWSTKGN